MLTKNVIVQRLTAMEWLVCSSTDEDARVLKTACIFWALRMAVDELKKFYWSLVHSSPKSPPLNNSHPRFYPTPTSFFLDESQITFTYLEHLDRHATCVTFKARITDAPPNCKLQIGSKVVIKFVPKYGEQVHKHLAKLGFAPTLYFVGPVPEWKWLVEAHQRPAHTMAQGLTFKVSLMVVMAFVESEPADPELEARQVAEILYHLHTSGFVFGDLRRPNILFNGQHVIFIDFDWSGYYNARDSDTFEEVPQFIRNSVKELSCGTEVARFPLSVYEKLFHESHLGLKPVLPRHDWKMWRNLFKLTPDKEEMILGNLSL